MDLAIPLSFFVSASDETLQSFALKRLEHAANLEREARSIKDEARRSREAAEVALWLKENRAEILRTAGAHLEDAKRDAA